MILLKKECERKEESKCSRKPATTPRQPEKITCTYNKLVKTQQFTVADGFVTFTKHFKYLRSYTSYNLRDGFDIDTYIVAASRSMGALSIFWNNPHVDTYATS